MSEEQLYDKEFVQFVISKIKMLQMVIVKGSVSSVQGTMVISRFPQARVGDLCRICPNERIAILAEVIGFDDEKVLLSALNPVDGIEIGAVVEPLYVPHRIWMERSATGRILDGFGRPLDDGKSLLCLNNDQNNNAVDVLIDKIDPTSKPRITNSMTTGIRAIDGLLTIGEGQRIGIFAGAGCGKTTLIAEIARTIPCDVIVFGLIGERGRELNEFIEHELDDRLRERTILVCATSDRSSMERARAAFTATAIAEGFRNQGKKVLLLIDSLTRFARAQREIGLAAGEPPGRGGFPPSVAALMPRLLERAGLAKNGSVTAIYTVLIEQDSMSDPIADEARSLLDGHIILSRKLADKGHYPAIDIASSLSRTMSNVISEIHQPLAKKFRELLSAYKEIELLLKLGEYEPGFNALTDEAVRLNPSMMDFLKQPLHDSNSLEQTIEKLRRLIVESEK